MHSHLVARYVHGDGEGIRVGRVRVCWCGWLRFWVVGVLAYFTDPDFHQDDSCDGEGDVGWGLEWLVCWGF